jgi:RimJ/RimL family protein N-acetyltransferase
MIHSVVLLSLENLKPFMDWSHRETSIEQQKERIRASMESFSKGISYDFVVVDIETKEFLMSASLHTSRVPNKKSLGIGYWTSSMHCNKGLATLVTKILVVTAFEKLGCDRVEIGCNKANQKSIRVIEKTGFKFECEARNYFSEPAYDTIKNGYNQERTGLLYTLVKTDINDLKWYDSILGALTFK